MYARVLCVGSAFNEQTEFCGRILQVLQRAGHGVRVCPLPREVPSARDELVAALDAFRPTLVLWDADGAVSGADDEVLGGLACCKVAFCGSGEPPEYPKEGKFFDFIVRVSAEGQMGGAIKANETLRCVSGLTRLIGRHRFRSPARCGKVFCAPSAIPLSERSDCSRRRNGLA